MATAPNVQNEAATTRRYSSIPAPMYFGDLVRKPARADSQITRAGPSRPFRSGSSPSSAAGRAAEAHVLRQQHGAADDDCVRDPKIAGVPPLPLRAPEHLFLWLHRGPDDGELGATRGRFGCWDSDKWTGALPNDHGFTPRPGYERTHRWSRRSQRGVRRLRRLSNRAVSGRRAESVMAVMTKTTCKDAFFDLARVPLPYLSKATAPGGSRRVCKFLRT